ncbi:MAG: S9 family peptidase [Sphingobium sp.]|nr:S9 family peptidase [Sphingobium sp.]
MSLCAALLAASGTAWASDEGTTALAGAALTVATPPPPSPVYPETRRDDLVETRFGVRVPDPYRWLEDDARADPDVASWVVKENGATQTYLATLPGREALRARMTALYNYERNGLPRKGGSRYFYTRNSGLQSQAPLYVREGLEGAERLLLDPNALSSDGSGALAQWEPSEDGRHLLYAVQDSGSDWRTLQILDVESGRLFDEKINHVKFSSLAWRHDGRGFFYARFDIPAEGSGSRDALPDQRIYYHILGTPQSADRLIFSTPGRPDLRHEARVTDDGRWLLIRSTQGTGDEAELTLLSLADEGAAPRRLVRGFTNNWVFAGSQGDRLFFRTDFDAPLGRIVVLDAARRYRKPVQLIAQRSQELVGASLIGNRLILAYLHEGRSIAELADLDGNPLGAVPLPGFGTAAGFAGRAGDPETFIRFSDFTTPGSVYRLDVDTGKLTVFAQPRLPFDPAAFETVQVFFPSKDGTRVPLYLVRRKDVAAAGKPVPTLLYGYGGFNRSISPSFSPTQLAWVEQGGALAVASLRGGGEFGKAWHDAGRLSRKQNVFDDFIAAAEYLKTKGITGADQLAIEGRSNGGLLVGAVVNQRPDLFAAALPAVGVLDMLRFDRFTAGRYWIEDYGDPGREADFRTLLAYSPYHNIADGRAYPAILVITADSDDRVVPAHSYKYAAALQNARIGDRPHLLRVETGAGHGSGKPVDKLIEEASDIYSFAAYWTGLRIEPK